MKRSRTIACMLLAVMLLPGCAEQQIPDNDADSENVPTVSEEIVMRNDGPVEVGIYEQYDLDTYMRPVWEGRVVHNETVMFIGENDSVSLLYPADEILSVRSYDLMTEYEQGVDYAYCNGKIALLEGSRIPAIAISAYYADVDGEWYLQTKHNGMPTDTYWGEGTTMTQWQVAVTYTHSQYWSDDIPASYADRYEKLRTKLENGENVTFVFYGDSITYGANSSAMIGVEPFAPTWPVMFTQYVAQKYSYRVEYIALPIENTPVPPKEPSVYGDKGVITYINASVGGWGTETGSGNMEMYINQFVRQYGCDLFVVAYGMNNSDASAEGIAMLHQMMIEKVHNVDRDTCAVMVSTMVPNPEALGHWYGNQDTFEAEMIKSADECWQDGIPCAVAPVTSMSLSVLESKRFCDYTGNNINHPNDFMARIYAQTLFQTVFGYSE